MIVTVGSLKGGTGKSTLATALAGALTTLKKKQVTLVDADPQESSKDWCKSSQQFAPLAQIKYFDNAAPDLHFLDLDSDGNLVIIDCPGAINAVLESALHAADGLLIPVRPSYSDARSLPKLEQEIARISAARRKPPLAVAVVLSQVRWTPRLEQKIDDIRNGLPPNFHLMKTRIRLLQDFDDAFGAGCTPIELNAHGEAARDLRSLADELLTWTKTKCRK